MYEGHVRHTMDSIMRMENPQLYVHGKFLELWRKGDTLIYQIYPGF